MKKGTSTARQALQDDVMLSALLDHSQDIIYFKDREGRFLQVSQAMARWFGEKSPDDMVGKSDWDYFTTVHAQRAAKDEARILKTRVPMQGKIERETWPGRADTWVSTSKMPLRDKTGRVIGIFGMSRDVTDQHLAAERLEIYAAQLQRQNEAYESDLRLASELFTTYAASAPPALPPGEDAARAPFLLAHHYQPAAAVGGDFFLVLPMEHGRTRVLLCDVMGHGTQAALVAVMLRAWARDFSRAAPGISDWLQSLNERLIDTFGEFEITMMATAWALDIDTRRGRIAAANAGHPEAFVQWNSAKKADAVHAITRHGPALGIQPGAEFPCETIALDPGDKFVLYTDGLTECRNRATHEFESNGVRRVLLKTRGASGKHVVAELLAAARAHCGKSQFEDDVCVLVLERAQRRRPTTP